MVWTPHQGIHWAPLYYNCKGNSLAQIVWSLHSQTLSLMPIGHRKKQKLDSNSRYGPGYFKESYSGEYHMYHQFILLHSYYYLNKISVKINVANVEGNSQDEIWHWTRNEIWVSVQSWLWVRLSWTHGLIAQLVRVSQQNSVIMGSISTQANFLRLPQRILLWW